MHSSDQQATAVADSPSLGLTGVSETLLVPLAYRALEAERRDALVRDPYALQIVQQTGLDLNRFRTLGGQVDVAVRTEILDRAVARFFETHPTGTVVNLGAGLDARGLRLAPEGSTWYDLDLPPVIELRRRFLPESDTRICIPKSLLDLTWFDDVAASPRSPVLLIAEGVFPYFHETVLRDFVTKTIDRFPRAELLFHSTAPWMVREVHKDGPLQGMVAPFRWGTSSGRTIETWDSRIEFIEEWPYIKRHPSRWGWRRYAAMLPLAGRWLREVMKIAHVRFHG
ncbi:MAG TPA: class I SAM-dependent methyltransferase [Pirellulales bacterium]